MSGKRYKIGLDGRSIYRANRRGTGKNLIDLYRHLARLHPEWEIVVFHQTPDSDDPFEGFDNIRPVQIDLWGDRWDLWQRIRLPIAARGVDVLHCPANTAPGWVAGPMILTLHDLIPVEFGGDSSENRKWMKNAARAAKQARWIITPSEYTRTKIVQEFSVPADKVIINHWAPDTGCREVTDPAELDRIRTRYGLEPGQPYVLGFGAVDPRKNTLRMLQSWKGLPDRLRQEYRLVLVGIQEPALSYFQDRACELGIKADCRLHGFAAEEDLSGLFSGATALWYPSLSEGFGLPILDAFTCRTPTLTSNVSSLPEVAGEAAIFVNPLDVEAMTDRLAGMLEDQALREQLVERGSERVKNFTWEACARRVSQVFEWVIWE